MPGDEREEAARSYVQAIPLYSSADRAVFEYFKNHKDAIDAETDSALTIALPEKIEHGDLSAIRDLFGIGTKRYPGLRRADLPCFWLEDAKRVHEIVRLPAQLDQIVAYVRSLADAATTQEGAKAIKAEALRSLDVNLVERSSFARLMMGALPVSKSNERLLAAVFGVIFVGAILALAVFFPTPTPFQYLVFRIVLAIAAAGFVSMTPGFLEVNVPNIARAGGALAVFLVIFFYNPAELAGWVAAPT